MILLGIDYGAKKIGLAKAERNLALPLTIIANTNQTEVLAKIKKICDQENIQQIIIGVPVSLQRSVEHFLRDKDLQNKQLQEVLVFVDWLKSQLTIPIEVEDERLSTKLAKNLQQGEDKKSPDDAIAAMLILQAYLDRQRHLSD